MFLTIVGFLIFEKYFLSLTFCLSHKGIRKKSGIGRSLLVFPCNPTGFL